MLDKAYVRFRENIPDNANTYAAAEGFHIQGIPVVPFYGFGDLNLENMPDLGPATIGCRDPEEEDVDLAAEAVELWNKRVA